MLKAKINIQNSTRIHLITKINSKPHKSYIVHKFVEDPSTPLAPVTFRFLQNGKNSITSRSYVGEIGRYRNHFILELEMSIYFYPSFIETYFLSNIYFLIASIPQGKSYDVSPANRASNSALALLVNPRSSSVPEIVLSKTKPMKPATNMPVLSKIWIRLSASSDPVFIVPSLYFAHCDIVYEGNVFR